MFPYPWWFGFLGTPPFQVRNPCRRESPNSKPPTQTNNQPLVTTQYDKLFSSSGSTVLHLISLLASDVSTLILGPLYPTCFIWQRGKKRYCTSQQLPSWIFWMGLPIDPPSPAYCFLSTFPRTCSTWKTPPNTQGLSNTVVSTVSKPQILESSCKAQSIRSPAFKATPPIKRKRSLSEVSCHNKIGLMMGGIRWGMFRKGNFQETPRWD